MLKYCKDCKHCYYDNYSSYGGDFCCKLKVSYVDNFYTRSKVSYKCKLKNEHNNCQDYKRIWYKFWIKGE